MRKIMTVVLASAVVFSMMPGLVASATDPDPATPLWGGGPVSEATNYEISPRVDGGVVVWADQDAGSLHYRSVQSGTAAVVYDEGFSRGPDIAGDLVVWTEFATDADGDVWMKDLSGGLGSEVATSTELDEVRPRTDGDVIAWLEGTDLDGYHVAGTVLSTGAGFQLERLQGGLVLDVEVERRPRQSLERVVVQNHVGEALACQLHAQPRVRRAEQTAVPVDCVVVDQPG